MRLVAIAALLTAVVLCGSCRRSAVEPSQNLVGAKGLPSATVLSRESILIYRGHWGLVGSDTPGSLNFEIHPDNSLSVERTRTEPKTWKQITVQKELPHLSPASAQAMRQMLWRLRPANLEGVAHEILPAGCDQLPTDSGPEFVVNFIDESLPPGKFDRGIGIVLVPYSSQCQSSQANEARALVQKILQSFPKSKVAAEYDADEQRWNERRGSHSPHSRQS